MRECETFEEKWIKMGPVLYHPHPHPLNEPTHRQFPFPSENQARSCAARCFAGLER